MMASLVSRNRGRDGLKSTRDF